VADLVLEARNLRRTFNPGTANEVRALQGVDLDLEPGAFVIVLGTNGSGKSTLLSAVAGTFPVDEGSIRIGGTDVTRWPEHRRASLIGRVFQNPFTGTAPRLTVAENLALSMRRGYLGGLGRALPVGRLREIRDRVSELGMGLEDRLNTQIGQLSGGQRQALTLLMATIVRPELLLLDEHTAALDPRSAEQVLRITQQVVTRDRLTTLMVTHAMPQATRLGDRVIMMHRGRIAIEFAGTRKRSLKVEDLLDRFDQLRAAELLDESAAAMLRAAYV
jgi:putative ABC transport system ATP-binding protein